MRNVRWMAAAAAFLAIAQTAAVDRSKLVRVGLPKPEQAEARVVATIEGRSGSRMRGEAVFRESGTRVALLLAVEGVAPGLHGVHLHERGDCSAPDALSAGPHWNPTGEAHGRWGRPPFHRGDIGNILVGQDGKGSLTFETDLWTIGRDAKTDILNRAVVVHEAADDFVTQPTGNAGGRIGCGVVRLEP